MTTPIRDRLSEAAKKEETPLPCPFCGTAPRINMGSCWTEVSCENKQCPVQPSITQKTFVEALAAWNTRPYLADLARAKKVAAAAVAMIDAIHDYRVNDGGKDSQLKVRWTRDQLETLVLAYKQPHIDSLAAWYGEVQP